MSPLAKDFDAHFDAHLLAQQSRFFDIQSGFWAEVFIRSLVDRGILSGFPDGSFRPNEAVTRAQFAAFLMAAFPTPNSESALRFWDVPADHWAAKAIGQAAAYGFLSGYADNSFQPNKPISRLEVLIALATGLNYGLENPADVVLAHYNDEVIVPGYARDRVAAATEKRIVVSYPDTRFLNPTRSATRAEVAALIYQALVSQGKAAAIDSPYIVSVSPVPVQADQNLLPHGTTIAVNYDRAAKVIITPQERTLLTLKIAEDLESTQGTIIPKGSEIVGELRPSEDGAKFVAQDLVLPDGQHLPLIAESQIVTQRETVNQETNFATFLDDSTLGTSAAAAISSIGADEIQSLEYLDTILGQQDVGALMGLFLGRTTIELLVIEPALDLGLTVTEDLILGQYGEP